MDSRTIRRIAVLTAGAMVISLGAVALVSVSTTSATTQPATTRLASATGGADPTQVALPDGFAPKDMAISGLTAYVGSRANGSIDRVNLFTGQTSQFSAPTGIPAVGIAIDNHGRLFVGDSDSGDARVLDTRTGQLIKTYTFGAGAFLSDAYYADNTVWFIDAFKPVLYKLELGPDGQLPAAPVTVTISGGGFNAADTPNGLTQTPDGRALLVGTTNSGQVFRIDPTTGAATQVNLNSFGLASHLTSEDALHVVGNTLYAAENAANTIATYQLDNAGTSGQLVSKNTNPSYDGPSDFAFFGNTVWVVNSREATTKVTPTTPYNLVSVSNPATWPTEFQLPNGFDPDQFTIGDQPYAYFGSTSDGSIYRVDLRTGLGKIIYTAPGPGSWSVGLKLDDRGRLFVAGGFGKDNSGQARVIDARTGKLLKTYTFAPSDGSSFTNNVLLADNAAWFGDSLLGVMWKLPLGPGGQLPAQAQKITLAGGGFAASDIFDGIATTPDGRGLIVDTTDTGQLYEINPNSGATQLIPFDGMGTNHIGAGDGLLREGNTLYVCDRLGSKIWVFTLNDSATTAHYDLTLTDPRFQGVSAVWAYGNRLYVPTVKRPFNTDPTVPYDVVSIPVPTIQ